MAVDCKEMHPVMVTTDLHRLILAAVVDREGWHAAQDWLAPWQDELHTVSFGNGHPIGTADRDWFEIEAALAGSSITRADEQRGDRCSQRASEHVPALQTPRDKIAKTRVSGLKAWRLITAVAANNLDGLVHLGPPIEGFEITAAV
jgi:hypothetical protein